MGEFLTFKTFAPTKVFVLVWQLKLASLSLLKSLSPLMLCLSLPPKKIVLTYFIRLLDDMIELLKGTPHPFPLFKKEIIFK